MRHPHHHFAAIDQKFGVHRVAVARGNAVPEMRKLAMVGLIGQARGNVEFADELAHRAQIWNSYGCRHVGPLAIPY